MKTCISTPENIYTADDCTLHDHEQTVYVVHEPENLEEPVFVFGRCEAAELFKSRRAQASSYITEDPLLDMDFAREAL